MKLLIGTNNAGKVTEISECLCDVPLQLLAPKDLEMDLEPPPETGETFAENAAQKARYFHVHTGLPTIADDSGIEIDALKGELGVHTRRWGAGPEASDEEWIAHFLKRMKEEENKKARFVCHLAHFDADGTLHMFEGICDGEITEELEADYLPGLPISACFRPNGYDLVYSAMSIEQKNSTSHRGRALKEFRGFLTY
jgi:XTP/dITP diphosphohydrolase